MRGIDHLVLPVNDTDAARETCSRLGFTCTPDAFHPFGTKNFLVQLQGVFLEVLGVHDRGLFPQMGPEDFNFPQFNADFLARNGEGFSMLVMDSTDPDADRAGFAAAGLRLHAPFSFGRVAVLPDGTKAQVGFDLTFVSDADMPDCGFFTCRQKHPPELFWKPDYQRHANTAQTVKTVVMAGEDWREHVAFLRGFTGAVPVQADDHVRFETGRGAVVAGTPAFASELLGQDIAGHATMRLAGYEIGVADVTAARKALDAGGMAFREAASGALSASAHGVAIAFSA